MRELLKEFHVNNKGCQMEWTWRQYSDGLGTCCLGEKLQPITGESQHHTNHGYLLTSYETGHIYCKHSALHTTDNSCLDFINKQFQNMTNNKPPYKTHTIMAAPLVKKFRTFQKTTG